MSEVNEFLGSRTGEARSDAPRPEGETRAAFQALNIEYPRVWWPIAWSGDATRGEVIPLKILERDIVLWRDKQGELHCHAAHCAHLGAHLGYLGEVNGSTLRCPFHGWCYEGSGTLVAQPGPDRIREGIWLPTYRIVERYGAVFLWNGAGDPDYAFPDILAEGGFAEKDVTFHHHRWHLPFPSKWLNENVCDGMHLAVFHDAGEWGDTVIESASPTVLRMRCVIHNPRRWLGWANVKRRFQRRELLNLLTPVTNDLIITAWGGPINLVRFVDRPGLVFGTVIALWAPIDANSHYIMDITLVPRIRIPLVGRAIEKVAGFLLGLGTWSTIVQDAGLLMTRAEPPNPPYTPRDKGLIAFRRLSDSRIVTNGPLAGDNIRSNGARAGIRVKTQHAEVPDATDNGCGGYIESPRGQ